MKSKEKRPYLDFYGKHKISPVSQDISNIKKHYERRESLYRRLGIVPSFLENKSIIEFGPGSGHNALYTYSLKPFKYVLVDGNPAGLEECERLLRQYYPEKNPRYVLVQGLIEEYKSRELYDVVLCEGLIAGQKNPKQFLSYIAKFTKPGGVCIITSQDCIGYFTDLLRCLIGAVVVKRDMSFEKKIEILLSAFEQHLKNLKGMSRFRRDWIIDNILNIAVWRDAGFLSIEEAITTLRSSFDVHGVSPHFFSDWRWYKTMYGENKSFNSTGIDCYRRNIHNLLDYRYEFIPRSEEENTKIYNCCYEIRQLISCYGHDESQEFIKKICQKGHELERLIRTFSPVTADALSDFLCGIENYPNLDQETDWGSFLSWWGRGMQYLSFIRNS